MGCVDVDSIVWIDQDGVACLVGCSTVLWGKNAVYLGFIRSGLEAIAAQLKDIPALEDIVKPFLHGKVEKKATADDVAAVSHSAIGGISSVEKRSSTTAAE